MARWAIKNDIKRVVTLVADYAPGLETEKAFMSEFKAMGGEIVNRCAFRCKVRISRRPYNAPAMQTQKPYSSGSPAGSRAVSCGNMWSADCRRPASS